VLTTAVPKSLENGIVLCSWPVPPVSCPSERPAGENLERASELQNEANATLLPGLLLFLLFTLISLLWLLF